MSRGTKPNRQIWDRVLAGDVSAYQTVVESHQSAVSAVAYAIVGDFPLSQDIAQETFWVAWTKRNSLRDVGRLGSWLCGIARNLARQWRKKHKRRAKAAAGDLPYEPAAETLDPAAQTIAKEEQQVVWSALEEIPENYREVLTLYYRQGRSIAEVSDALDITEETARQRLSRGRSMLRGRVSQLIEGVLVRSKPDKSFAARVIAGLTGAGLAATGSTAAASTMTAAKTVTSATGLAAAKGAFATGATVGVLGGLFGAIGGLAGGWLGSWLPAQLAPTETERQFLLYQGRTALGMAIVYTIGIFALALAYAFLQFDPLYFFAALAALTLAFMIPLTIHTVRLSRLVRKLRDQIDPEDDPNQSPLAAYGKKWGIHTARKGRSYRSDLELFGVPLIDIQFSDADFGGNPLDKSERKHARGWIALGDRATGILFAAGGIAKGFLAFGGVAIGAISVGGLSFGVLSLGGMALGLIAIGGGAVGYDAVGGGAIGWHSAAGGIAVAWHAAVGGVAVAHDYAVGGVAAAVEANTLVAEEVIRRDTMNYLMDWVVQNMPWFIAGVVFVSLMPVLALKWIYQKAEPASDKPEKFGPSE